MPTVEVEAQDVDEFLPMVELVRTTQEPVGTQTVQSVLLSLVTLCCLNFLPVVLHEVLLELVVADKSLETLLLTE
jgi:hypothetical protein